jgi:hypothetical protein
MQLDWLQCTGQDIPATIYMISDDEEARVYVAFI